MFLAAELFLGIFDTAQLRTRYHMLILSKKKQLDFSQPSHCSNFNMTNVEEMFHHLVEGQHPRLCDTFVMLELLVIT